MKNTGLKVTRKARPGYTQIVSPKNAGLRLIELGTIVLGPRDTLALPSLRKEVIVTLLRGRCTFKGDGQKLGTGSRKNIFEEQAWALYARGIKELKITARSRVEALFSAVPAVARKPFIKLIGPQEVVEQTVGSGTFERRVRTIVGEDFPAKRLLAGETINEAGKWSSYPPHRHEKDSPPHEAKLEEVYFYKLEKPNGFGMQRIYTDDGRIDEVHIVRDGDLCVLPRGYHPVSTAPISKLYYFWVLAGKTRKMLVRVDPNFA